MDTIQGLFNALSGSDDLMLPLKNFCENCPYQLKMFFADICLCNYPNGVPDFQIFPIIKGWNFMQILSSTKILVFKSCYVLLSNGLSNQILFYFPIYSFESRKRNIQAITDVFEEVAWVGGWKVILYGVQMNSWRKGFVWVAWGARTTYAPCLRRIPDVSTKNRNQLTIVFYGVLF